MRSELTFRCLRILFLTADDVFQYDEHGTEVFSVIAGYQEGAFTGGSYEAEYQLYVTEDVSLNLGLKNIIGFLPPNEQIAQA